MAEMLLLFVTVDCSCAVFRVETAQLIAFCNRSELLEIRS